MRHIDFTSGDVGKKILLFSLPLMVGNVFQQLYNVVDTLVVGKFLGEAPLAAVGSAYTLMIFLTSILIGLTMGCSVYFSLCFGRKNFDRMRQSIFISFLSIGLLTIIMNGAVYILLDGLISFMQVPFEVIPYIRDYLWWIFAGLWAVFLFNFGAALLRAVGDSVTPPSLSHPFVPDECGAGHPFCGVSGFRRCRRRPGHSHFPVCFRRRYFY